jgi:hypothetical protein
MPDLMMDLFQGSGLPGCFVSKARVKVRINVKHLSGLLTRCFYFTTISKRTLMFAFAAVE